MSRVASILLVIVTAMIGCTSVATPAGSSNGDGDGDSGNLPNEGGASSDPDAATGGPNDLNDAKVPPGGDPDPSSCAVDADCDDGKPCTKDRCADGVCEAPLAPANCGQLAACGSSGECVEAPPCGSDADCADDDPCTVEEACAAASATCTWRLLDRDADGYVPLSCGGDDYDDSAAAAYPGAPEICDGIDNDRNGQTDEEPAAGLDCWADGGECRNGHCMNCTDEDVEYLLSPPCCGEGAVWNRLRVLAASHEDPLASIGRAQVGPSCVKCLVEFTRATLDCADAECWCQPGSRAAAELQRCANGIDWCGEI